MQLQWRNLWTAPYEIQVYSDFSKLPLSILTSSKKSHLQKKLIDFLHELDNFKQKIIYSFHS